MRPRPEPTAPPGAAVTPPAAARPPTGGRPCRLSDAAVAALQLWQAARPRLAEALAGCRHGRLLVEAGFAADLDSCAQVDAHPVVPVYYDRQITKLGPEWER